MRSRASGALAAAWIGAAWMTWAALGCGYRTLDAATDPAAPFTVIGALPRAPSAAVAAAVEAGARSELARSGALATGSQAAAGAPAIEIELLRIDEDSEGISVSKSSGAPGEAAAPLARGLRVTVTGRARLWPAGARSGSPTAARAPLRETGAVEESLVISRGQGDAGAASAAREDAARLAGRRLGERLARQILGIPNRSGE